MKPMQKDVVIAGYARSPYHFANKGELARVRPDELAAQVVRGLIEKTGVEPADIEDLIMGCAFPEGEQGLNVARIVGFLAELPQVARIVGFLAELPQSVAGTTVNRFCGSSMQAIHMAAGAIQMDAGEAFICAGVESMTRVPATGFNPMLHPGLAERYPQAYISMGETAENLVGKYGIARDRQESLALESHQRASAAREAGKFDEELVPIEQGNLRVEADGCIRPGTSLEALADLKPAFKADGSVTAGTSSPLTDGATAVLVTSKDYAAAHGLAPLARIRSVAVSGCRPEIMGIGPVAASRKALDRAGRR
jgi:acetyl-CoA acyltransferase